MSRRGRPASPAQAGRKRLEVLAVGLGLLTVGSVLVFVSIFRGIRRSERRFATARTVEPAPGPHVHTKWEYIKKLRQAKGPATLALFSEIGDRLDQMSGWRRSTDVVMETLEDRPELVVDFLLEKFGIDRVRELVEDDGTDRE